MNSVAIGPSSGQTMHGTGAVAVGHLSGLTDQGASALAVVRLAGQKEHVLAIGFGAGNLNQGDDAVAVGRLAGQTQQAPNSIVLNASGVALDAVTEGLFVDPIRMVASGDNVALACNAGAIAQGDKAVAIGASAESEN
ncbi:hypothetical protein SARC_06978 [Sphaeroforma arctica JP610]|uniref:Trimeric autotransporter adhesin YadA-like head domain-containing protein n=1 Tax=Sphaeroforma arctica JP610 TaxID=667725 RepID=A0A0L0FVK2_9EUKA|nr:hypothetical protein SARC_06978 [Sphaeroforma arctica JP610]KNC80664.1 hypothetical protein SARC_06978 [Sphaeroforma arctica JP610]|eukprot:XP_014154566.1 hypothetical protein SARC_06978 [Sphaeroforma arctica JP610]